ncbi:hypothetical protein BpHYR1_001953 [Brachionus plicatilis]|uniref:Uncharacterized protein n=1 Tax=Brachionus plicatilis TaxID=10195 RepID=A0A3M7RUT3_BRAPC|nr:hypothetical protein BpHYR1_001953 [Brachionus plicatilis]
MNTTQIERNGTKIAESITQAEKEAFFNSSLFIFTLIGIILAVVLVVIVIFIIRKRNSTRQFRDYEDFIRDGTEFHD